MARMRFALGCCWAAMAIQHEHCGTSAAATAGSNAALKTLTSPARYDPPILAHRTLAALLLIAAVHAALIYALASGFGRTVIEAISPPIDILPAPPKPIEPPPPPPGPRLVPHNVDDIPAPELPIDSPPDAGRFDVIPTRPREPEPPPAGANRVVGGPGNGFPNTAEYYPPASRRLAETGTATVRVCVDDRGRLTTAPTIAQASGSMRLDEGALNLARAGSGHYRPTTEDGRPVGSCYVFRVRFELRD